MVFLRNASASLAALALLGCGGEGSVSNAAHLRFFDAFSDQSNVRLTVGSRTYSAGGTSFENGDDPKYGNVPSGTVDLNVLTYDQTTSLATLTAQNLVEGANYTVVASTSGTTRRLTLYRDGATPSTGAAIVRVINAYTGNTSVFLRLFKDSDNSLAYQTNTTASNGLASVESSEMDWKPVVPPDASPLLAVVFVW
ncbi:hypothetical protein EON79_20270 [bacterium]|nr:MAG: hypothetical protein EON79_20270 [bacterium]